VTSIIPGLQRHKGFMGLGIDTYNLILTPRRLVFAYVSQNDMKALVMEARDIAKAEGKGFLGQAAAQMGWLNLLLERYSTMTVDDILARYSGSFFVPNTAVSRVRVNQRHSAPDEPTRPIEVTFETTGGKHKFEIAATMAMSAREVKQRLQQGLGSVVR